MGSTRAVRLTNELERDIAGFFWKGNDTLLYLRDFKGDENFHLFAVKLHEKQVRDLTPSKTLEPC